MFYKNLNKRRKTALLSGRCSRAGSELSTYLLCPRPLQSWPVLTFLTGLLSALMLNMIIPRLPDLTSLQLNRNVVLISMSASSLLGNFRPKKYQFPRLEINDVYFLKVCVFVLINLSIITFFESFIIISSESLYQLNSRISLEPILL